jgi:hypothetical protein
VARALFRQGTENFTHLVYSLNALWCAVIPAPAMEFGKVPDDAGQIAV